MAEKYVNVVTPGGSVVSLPDGDPEVKDIIAEGGRLQSPEEFQAEVDKRDYADRGFEAGVVGAVDTATFGGASALYRAAGQEDEARKVVQANPIAHGIGVAAGALAPIGVPGLAAKAGRIAGAAVKGVAEGSAVARIAGAAAGAALEGGIVGADIGAGEMFRAPGPLDVEHIASGFKTGALVGAVAGGGSGLLSEAAEVGGRFLARRLAGAGAKGVQSGEQLAAEITALRNEANELPWGELPFSKQLKKRSLKAVKNLANYTDAPEFLAKSPWQSAKALEIQSAAFKEMLAEAPAIRAKLVEEGAQGGARWKALDKLEDLLERNQGIRTRVDEFERVVSAGKERGLAQQLMEGAVFVGATKATSFLGPLAPVVGAKASKMVSDLVFAKGMGAKFAGAAANGTARIADIARAIASPKVIKAAVPFGVLGSVRYAPPAKAAIKNGPELLSNENGVKVYRAKGDEIFSASSSPKVKQFRERAQELKSQVAVDLASGKLKVTPKARQALGERLRGVAAFSPKLADALEAHVVNRLEYLAEKMPKRPGTIRPPGPDRWQPAAMGLASFERTAAAVEDPLGAAERFAAGNATPEDADALKAVWPEMYRDLQTQIATHVGTLRETLPYTKRLMLSILSGVPVDPAMEPRILDVLQGHFESEPGTEGGIQAPTPQPQFGSVSKPEPTSAQMRAG